MKKIILAIFTLLFLTNLSFAQIPNFSFESWTSMGSYETPDQWGTMNNTSAVVSVFTATKATPGNPGSFYLNLTSKTTLAGVLNGIAVSGKLDSTTMLPVSGFAFNLRPQSLTGKWQHMIYGTSAGSVSVLLTKWNTLSSKRDTVATAYRALADMIMSWANFSINLTYQSGEYPDSCIIVLQASGSAPTNQDYLYVDNLAFIGSVASVENNTTSLNVVSIFPNPSNSLITINLIGNSTQTTLIELLDLEGRVVISKNAGILPSQSKQIIDVSSLSKGVYIVNIKTGNETVCKKIVLQ